MKPAASTVDRLFDEGIVPIRPRLAWPEIVGQGCHGVAVEVTQAADITG
jgi:hypothetical protein